MEPSSEVQHHHQMSVSVSVESISAAGGDRFPQWSVQETRDFLMIRAELDPTFMETKRNKVLWEVISTKMKERGYNRSGEQCKCKWKNLVTRYKGFETMESQEGLRQQFPFYNELQAIFTGRMQRMLWLEAESGGSSKKHHLSTSDDEEDEHDHESDVDKNNNKKKKNKMVTSSNKAGIMEDSSVNNLKEILEDFMKQQMQMETRWMKAYEAIQEERRIKEMEWRQTMEALQNERIMFDQSWREREEQRRIREESRSEKRDALITALLNNLNREAH